MARSRRPGAGEGRARQRLVRLSLRSRITLSFAFGALVLSSALALITYFATRSQIVSQEITAVQRQAYANAVFLYDQVTSLDTFPSTAGPAPSAPLTAITQIDEGSSATSNPGPVSMYYSRAQGWTERAPNLGPELLPASLKESVITTGQPAYQVFNQRGGPKVAVGVPIAALDAVYFEIFPLDQTLRTLQTIFAALVAAGIVTTLAGAVLGRWAAGRALRPLGEVSDAALAIASGRLSTRLETADARDLAVIASSFNRMVDRLQQRIEREARFTSDVSHELRSPLTTLAASLSVIEARRDELPERARQALDLVGDEVRRFQRMVGELLEISRLDTGSADFEASTVPIGELVRRAVATSGGAGIPVDIDPAAADARVVVDKRRIERVLANLLENAERYAGGATRVRVERAGTNLRIIVEDQGPGVPLQERERIFERFARGSMAAGSRGAGGGTGLGLALVQEHVKLHSGRVWIEDRPGGGARFVVELPGARGEESTEDAELPTPPPPLLGRVEPTRRPSAAGRHR